MRDCDLGRVVARRGWEWLGGRAWDLGSASGMETYFWSGGFEAGWILLMIPFLLNNNFNCSQCGPYRRVMIVSSENITEKRFSQSWWTTRHMADGNRSSWSQH